MHSRGSLLRRIATEVFLPMLLIPDGCAPTWAARLHRDRWSKEWTRRSGWLPCRLMVRPAGFSVIAVRLSGELYAWSPHNFELRRGEVPLPLGEGPRFFADFTSGTPTFLVSSLAHTTKARYIKPSPFIIAEPSKKRMRSPI